MVMPQLTLFPMREMEVEMEMVPAASSFHMSDESEDGLGEETMHEHHHKKHGHFEKSYRTFGVSNNIYYHHPRAIDS